MPRQDLNKIAEENERAAFQDGRKEGYEEGYNKGFKDATRAIVEAANSIKSSTAPTSKPSRSKSIFPTFHDMPAKSYSTPERVLHIITEKPGLTGVEIVRQINTNGIVVPERTIRTALGRLKRHKHLIVPKEGRWYLAASQ